jgi:SAM-dependent methyltransferase
MGFEAGIKEWKEFLKPGGYIAISEITWLTKNRPKAIDSFWKDEYAEMDTASHKIRILEENGFMPIGYFVLPESSWTDQYYIPMEKRFDEFLKKHNHSEVVKKMIDQQKEEIKTYNKYKDYYSYGFYIAKKTSKDRINI